MVERKIEKTNKKGIIPIKGIMPFSHRPEITAFPFGFGGFPGPHPEPWVAVYQPQLWSFGFGGFPSSRRPQI